MAEKQDRHELTEVLKEYSDYFTFATAENAVRLTLVPDLVDRLVALLLNLQQIFNLPTGTLRYGVHAESGQRIFNMLELVIGLQKRDLSKAGCSSSTLQRDCQLLTNCREIEDLIQRVKNDEREKAELKALKSDLAARVQKLDRLLEGFLRAPALATMPFVAKKKPKAQKSVLQENLIEALIQCRLLALVAPTLQLLSTCEKSDEPAQAVQPLLDALRDLPTRWRDKLTSSRLLLDKEGRWQQEAEAKLLKLRQVMEEQKSPDQQNETDKAAKSNKRLKVQRLTTQQVAERFVEVMRSHLEAV